MAGDVRNAVATRQNTQVDKLAKAQRFIDSLEPQIARAIPKHLTADRLARIATTAVRQTPKLADCSGVSMAGALLTAAAMGLEPNTPTAECYLVPHGNEVTLILGYQGVAKLYWQHPLAAQLECEVVYEADDFDYSYGSGAHLNFTPNKRVADRGKVIYYYAFAKLKTGAEAFVVLTPEEVKAIRGGKTGPSGNIPDPQRWMERKVALKQMLKLLPKSATLAQAVDEDEKGGTELYRARAAERMDVPFDNNEMPAIEGSVDTATGEVVGEQQ